MTTDIQLREGESGLGPAGSPSFRLDKVNQCAWLGEEQISLSPKAFAVLRYLAERPGTLVTKQEVLDHVWPEVFVTEGVLKRAVLEIRKALSDSAEEPRFIQTLHRRGYRFLAQKGVESVMSQAAPAGEQQPGRRPLNVFHIVIGDGHPAWRDHSRWSAYTPRYRWTGGFGARAAVTRAHCNVRCF